MKIETQGKNNVLQSSLFELCVNLYVSGVQIQPGPGKHFDRSLDCWNPQYKLFVLEITVEAETINLIADV